MVRWMAVLVVLAAGAGEQAAPPDEEAMERGAAIVHEKCIECHSLRRVYGAHYDQHGWHEAIGRMVAQGLEITDQQRADVELYLAHHKDEHGLWAVLGQFHFFFIHFPIALLLVALFLEVLALAQGRSLADKTTHLLVRLAALAVVPTILFGLMLAGSLETMPPMLVLHRNLGLLTGALAIAAWASRELAVRRDSRIAGIVYRAALLAAAAAVGFAGHFGGVLVHGDYLAELMQLR